MHKRTPLVSIIINNYNYARFLVVAVNSALAQTYSNCEVLVVDDGSTDESRLIIEQYGDRVQSIFKTNGGQGSTYNKGFEASRGDLILYLDSDDFLAPDAVERVVSVWDPSIAKVHFYLRVVEGADGTQCEAVLPASPLVEGDLTESIIRSGCYASPPASGNAYSRTALAQILPMEPTAWVVAADTYTIFLTPFFGNVRSCRSVLGYYRVHGSNQDAQTHVTGELLRYRLDKEERRDRMLAEFCLAHNLIYALGAVGKHFNHQKIRLSSLVLNQDSHPYKSDRLLRLVFQTVRILWREDRHVLNKLMLTFWAVSFLALPRVAILRTIRLAFVTTSRPWFVQSFVKISNLPLSTLFRFGGYQAGR